MIKIINFVTQANKCPFEDWVDDLDTQTQVIITKRITRLRLGNFGDFKKIKGSKDIWELVMDFGPGYRIYFAKEGQNLVILLAGGIKRSQSRDIKKAEKYWQEYKDIK